MKDPSVAVRLEWRPTTPGTSASSPAIRVFKAVESNGGRQYLIEPDIAEAQTQSGFEQALGGSGADAGLVRAGHLLELPKVFLSENLTEQAPYKYLLFEGAARGKGELTLALYRSGKKVGEYAALHLELKDVRKMYDQADATPLELHLPYASDQPLNGQTLSFQSLYHLSDADKQWDESKECVVFIHGFQSEPNTDVLRAYAEPMFKRLWWQGYRGRFAALRWNNLRAFDGFNTSEYRAWKYGKSLKGYVEWLKTSLPDYKMNLAGHSLGGLLVSSALKHGLQVENVALLQAAVAAGCFDPREEINSVDDLLQAESEPHLINRIKRWLGHTLAPEEEVNSTPDWTQDKGYRGWMENVEVKTDGDITSFFNTNDYWLATGVMDLRPWLEDLTEHPENLGSFLLPVDWLSNQLNFKPDFNAMRGFLYSYDLPSNTGWCQRLPAPSPPNPRAITDTHEMMSFVARARSNAVGAESDVQGAISKAVNLAQYGFGRLSEDHMGEFAWSIQDSWPFYTDMAGALQLKLQAP